jgi:AcrR family transcriptional regulator
VAATSELTRTMRLRPQRSGPKEPTQERARRTRALILNAAAETFAEEGYSSVTLQDVADRAKLTKGAVYFHFGNKEALALAVVEEHSNRWQPMEDHVRALGLSPLETMLAVLDQAAEAFASDTVVQAGARLQIERALINADLPLPYVGWHDRLAQLASEAREAGQLRPECDPRVLARVFIAAFFGMQHISDVLTRRADLLERYAEIRDVVLWSSLA